MSAVSPPPLNGVVSRSEVFAARALPPAASSRVTRELPLYVEPLPDEPLISWLLRLATRLGVSMQALEHQALGIDSQGGRVQWWRRPHAWVLKRISDTTGVNIERLREVTLASWSIYRDDEASDRFNERRYAAVTPEWRAFHFVVCEQCLKADATPYLRLSWTIGWLAICPRHQTVMTASCDLCRGKLRTPRHSWPVPFSALLCNRCQDTVRFTDFRGDPTVIRLQDSLLRGKLEGSTEIGGLGRFTWPEVVTLCDVLVGTFWTALQAGEQASLYAKFKEDSRARWLQAPSHRYADLAFLGWLIGLWRECSGAEIGRDMLTRWLTGEPESQEVEPGVRQRIQALL